MSLFNEFLQNISLALSVAQGWGTLNHGVCESVYESEK